MGAYRLLNGNFVELTNDEEVQEIETAIAESPDAVTTHLQDALAKLADRKDPDYRNSIKESVSAVEAICRRIDGSGATLETALKRLQESGKIQLHKALSDGFRKIYGYTGDEDGVRHSIMDDPNIDQEDAMFMLVACSAFVNYLRVKAAKVGINLNASAHAD